MFIVFKRKLKMSSFECRALKCHSQFLKGQLFKFHSHKPSLH